MSAVLYVKDAGVWTAINFNGNTVHVKDAGVWIDMDAGVGEVHIKDSGVWIQAFPSDSITWTSYKTPTVAGTSRSGTPELSTDPAYVYTNVITASDPVGWDDRSDPTLGPSADGYDYEWSDDVPGQGHGAISRVAMTFEAKYLDAPDGSNSLGVSTGLRTNGSVSTPDLTDSYAVFTFDRTITAWQISDEDAGDLYNGSKQTFLAGFYDNSSDSADKRVLAKGFQAKVQYKHN